MTPAPPRFGLWFALTLALPAAFATAWVWLVAGGVIARAEADERHALEQALATSKELLLRALHSAALDAPVQLLLDADRLVLAPFVARQEAQQATPPAPASIAEQAAIARLAKDDVAGALPFFAHAREHDSLTPPGWLRYVEAQAVADPAAARLLLAEARRLHADASCGPVPFAVLALLAEARLASTAGSDLPATYEPQLVAAICNVAADVVPIVLAEVAATVPACHETTLAALRAAATAAAHHRELPVGLLVERGTAGVVLVPIDAEHCVALPEQQVAQLRDEALAQTAVREPSVLVSIAGDASDPEAPQVSVLGETWLASPIATPTSTLLTIAARTSLVLALTTLVLGNLLLLRLTRRESQLVRLRSDFVDVVSHELRTPLAALSLKAEMLASGDVPIERRPHYLHGLHHDVQRLTDQVERILDFGRLQRGAPLRREVVPTRELLARGLRSGRPALRLVAQHVELHVPRELPPVLGDVEVLGRALRNLLENAAKYAPAGSKVAVRAFAHGNELTIEVADRGPGVPPGDRSSIFQPFVRGSDTSSATPGSGLGLALVAAAASNHGGRVTVHERDGGGSVFTLHLPIHQGAAS